MLGEEKVLEQNTDELPPENLVQRAERAHQLRLALRFPSKTLLLPLPPHPVILLLLLIRKPSWQLVWPAYVQWTSQCNLLHQVLLLLLPMPEDCSEPLGCDVICPSTLNWE
jgi:hypothetical protein